MSNRFSRRLPSQRRQRQLSYAMEVSLVGLLFVGIDRGSVGIVVKPGGDPAPARPRARLRTPDGRRITLWVTSAAFLHALGTVGVPGLMEGNFHSGTEWWDHLTHALSASVVAAAGYATVRAVDEHSERVHLPRQFVALVILLFVLGFGVLWELLEFAIGIAARQ